MVVTPSDLSVTVREFQDGDIDDVNDLLVTHQPWIEYSTEFKLDASEIDERGDARVAMVDELFVGFVWWLPDGAFGESGYVKQIGVHSDAQSLGVGSKLMDTAESTMLSDERDSNVFLLVSDFNVVARRFYESRGFVEAGTIEAYVEKGIDEIVMRKTVLR